MSLLWKWTKCRAISKQGKCGVFLFLNCLMFSILGFLAWLILSRFALNTWDAAVCFTGYPGFFIGFVGGYIYLCRQELI